MKKAVKVGCNNEILLKVVAGLNYKLGIETTKLDGSCAADDFVVYNRFGKLSITSHDVNLSGCKSSK